MKRIASLWTLQSRFACRGRRSPTNSRHRAMQKTWAFRPRAWRGSRRGIRRASIPSRRPRALYPAPSSPSQRAASSLICRRSDFRTAPRRLPMKTDSIFWIASMSKPVTSVAAMILVDDGKLELDAPVAQYLPEIGEMRVAFQTDGPRHRRDGIRARSAAAPKTPDDGSGSAAPYVRPDLSGNGFCVSGTGPCGRKRRFWDSNDPYRFTGGSTGPRIDATRRWRISFPRWRACRSPISPARSMNMA